MTKLSVIIPVYNAEMTLPRTLESLGHIAPENRGQLEVIAVDDGSTDRSSFILRQFDDAEASIRLTVSGQTNAGASSARNHALSQATGEWVFFLDADDELAFDPVAFLQSATDETCFGFSIEYSGTGRRPKRVRPALVTQANWATVLTTRNPFQPSSLLIRRDCIDNHFAESIAYVEDWLFWMSNLRIFERMRTVPTQASARIHIHRGNRSSRTPGQPVPGWLNLCWLDMATACRAHRRTIS
jgi:glycosyltransferase involved in cell wall biosynthesis